MSNNVVELKILIISWRWQRYRHTMLMRAVKGVNPQGLNMICKHNRVLIFISTYNFHF